MAAATPVQSLKEEATCSICLEYYKDPVITKCGHNFCRSCISGCPQGSDSDLTCPQCREVCPQGDLRPNRQLQSMVELVKQLSLQPERAPLEPERGPLQPERAPGEGLCEEHEEKLKLFCEEDDELICVICRESSGHRSHTVYPTKEAAVKYKDKLQEWLLPLRKEKDELLASKLKEVEISKAMMGKLETEKQKTVVEFQRMRQLLMEQEREILQRLEEMEGRITTTENANISKLSQRLSFLSALISEIKMKCEQSAEELLKDVRSTLSRCESVKLTSEKFGDAIKKYKEHVILDVDTAHRNLALSEGGRRVTLTGSRGPLPRDHPWRFTATLSVLGRGGFYSGRHYWEVLLLQEGGGWSVGVTQESLSWKGGVTHLPERVVWALHVRGGQYQALTSPPTPPSPQQPPLKLGVYLDYEGGLVSFYNADTGEPLYTFTSAAFTGALHPYFWLSGGTDLRLV
ncbi:E3 ubiquitin-protein ligase TRIM39-like [Ambystoma mexicanum]|uniref:E3 ubiquitin-protein ligase TRIM39-like n=1 Tax=Ambystoma mexicanum TaxID=8296 RepID=UPI0037E85D76